MTSPKRIGVVGGVNRDTVVQANGRVETGLGGALYTALALVHLSGFEVELIARVGRDIETPLRQAVAPWPRLRLEGVHFVDSVNAHSHITYGADGNKVEILTGNKDDLQLRREEIVDLALGLDGVVVNFITGFDLELAAFDWLCRHVPRPILVDVHSLTLGRQPNGRRFMRQPPGWATWVSRADIVQMNQAEAELLAGANNHLAQFGQQLLALGPKAAIITRDRRGVFALERSPDGITKYQIDAHQAERSLDPTGCGDVFLAGLAAGVHSGKPLAKALELANRAAGLKVGLQGLAALEELTQLRGWH